MKLVSCFFLLAVNTFLYPSFSLAQSYSSRDFATVSVGELAMPGKAVKAFNKGTALLVKGDAQGSLPYFQTAIDLAPNASYRPYHNLALAHYRLGHVDAAEENFQKSIDLSKGNFAPSMFGLSMILYRRAEFVQAESLVQRAMLVAPGSGLGKYCLGLIQYSLGRVAEAERTALSAIQLDASETDAYVLLAHVHERLHNPSAVIADVQKYLKLSPNHDLQSDALALLQRAQQNIAPLSASLSEHPKVQN